MKFAAVFVTLLGAAAAFAPASNNKAPTTALGLTLEELGGSSSPIKNWDPCGLAESGSDETLRWYRAAELKHGRAAMIGTTGYLLQAAGFHFPGQLSNDVSFESLSGMSPVDQWEAVPAGGKAQILAMIFVGELVSEAKGTHYMKGGNLPEIVFPPIDFSGINADTLATKRTRELNNGRLAMIGMMSFVSEYNIPGSVPALSKIAAFHGA